MTPETKKLYSKRVILCIYGNYTIAYDPPPIPTRSHDYQFVHEDYDGPEDLRCGSGATVEDCKDLIDEIESEY